MIERLILSILATHQRVRKSELNFKARCQLFKLLNLIWMFKFWYENGAEKIGNVDGAFIIKFVKA